MPGVSKASGSGVMSLIYLSASKAVGSAVSGETVGTPVAGAIVGMRVVDNEVG